MRGLAGALIVTGVGTGSPASLDDLWAVRDAMPDTPLYVGSGATSETLPDLLEVADGAIVGTAAKVDADPRNPVDVTRVRVNGR